jgi:hypothetical protein
MNANASVSTNRLSALRQREPIEDSCAYRSNLAVWHSLNPSDRDPPQSYYDDCANLDSDSPTLAATICSIRPDKSP